MRKTVKTALLVFLVFFGISLAADSQDMSLAVGFLSGHEQGAIVLAWWDYGAALENAGLQTVISSPVPYMQTGQPTTAQKALAQTIYIASGEYPDAAMSERILAATPAFLSSDENNIMEIMNEYDAKYFVVNSLAGKMVSFNYLYCAHEGRASPDEVSLQENACVSGLMQDTVEIDMERISPSDLCPAQGTDETQEQIMGMIESGSGVKVKSRMTDKSYCAMGWDGNDRAFTRLANLDGSDTGAVINVYSRMTRPTTGYLIQTFNESGPMVTYSIYYMTPESARNSGLAFYSTNYYKGLVLGELEGFEQVYPNEKGPSPSEQVRVFKKKEPFPIIWLAAGLVLAAAVIAWLLYGRKGK